MRERPIICTGESVRAILDGRKTQTRRIIKPQPTECSYAVHADLYHHDPAQWAFWLPDNRMTEPRTWTPPHGVPGDRLWVKETWARIRDEEPGERTHIEYRADSGVKYPGEWPDDCGGDAECPRWKSPLHMARVDSRIDLELTDVRVQRLQDITEEDAVAEGAQRHPQEHLGDGAEAWSLGDDVLSDDPLAAFARAWDAINGKRAPWDSNPWVWALTFTPLTRRESK